MCAPSARNVDVLVDPSTAIAGPASAKTLAAAAAIRRKFMTNLLLFEFWTCTVNPPRAWLATWLLAQ
jgi:hypothetical protein